MKDNRFLTNKYTLSAIILLACLAADIILHKGMSRVIIPSTFTDKRKPQRFQSCAATLITNSKYWIKAVDNTTLMEGLPAATAGFECDVYFNKTLNHFQVYHDSAHLSELDADSLLAVYKKRNLSASVWFDFKNLDASNAPASLKVAMQLRRKYALENKLIIESSSPENLRAFCDSGFFTSYYVPYFNPYLITEDDLIYNLDSITNNLKKYPVTALSGYYFQYPVLKKYFPNFPILTWTDKSDISLISKLFNTHLENDAQIKIVLYPYQ